MPKTDAVLAAAELLMTFTDVARYASKNGARISPSGVRVHHSEGKLPCIKLGGTWMTSPEAAKQYIENLKKARAAPRLWERQLTETETRV